MVTLPMDPDAQFAAWKREMEERIRALETTRNLPAATIGYGRAIVAGEATLEIHNGDEAIAGLIGKENYIDETLTENTQASVRVDGAHGPILHVGEKLGMLYPRINLAWYDASAPANTTTSATFDGLWYCIAGTWPSQAVHIKVACGTSAGTVGEFRIALVHVLPDGTFGGLFNTDVYQLPAVSSEMLEFKWDPRDLGAELLSSSPLFQVQARRVSGAGTVQASVPESCENWDARDATSSGLVP